MAEWDEEEDEREIVIPKRRPLLKLLIGILGLIALAVGVWFLLGRIRTVAPIVVASARHVHSDVTGVGDSLDIVVNWRFTDTAGAQPDSTRLEVGIEGTDPTVTILPSRQLTDTLRIVGPPAGSTAKGHSCVAGVYRSRLEGESCTPWEFVRPTAETSPAKPGRDTSTKKPDRSASSAKSKTILRLVVRPSGRQVDPDIGGQCVAWQRDHPGTSVWVTVNETAVAPCMGPNGKPTVAQFCAFAVLEDGDRVKTENSINNPYCESLFRAWVRERIS